MSRPFTAAGALPRCRISSAHPSVAILDALKAVALPAVEVHLSDVSTREDFRQISYAGMACVKTYMGLGFEGYRQAILYLKQYLEEANA